MLLGAAFPFFMGGIVGVLLRLFSNVTKFRSQQIRGRVEHVHMNMKTYFRLLWARLRQKLGVNLHS